MTEYYSIDEVKPTINGLYLVWIQYDHNQRGSWFIGEYFMNQWIVDAITDDTAKITHWAYLPPYPHNEKE